LPVFVHLTTLLLLVVVPTITTGGRFARTLQTLPKSLIALWSMVIRVGVSDREKKTHDYL
jgi:hypothetical protein